jgi:hypothetical protein
MKCAAAVSQEHGDSAVVRMVGAGIGDDEVGVMVVVNVGYSDPARAVTGGDGELAEAGSLRVESGTEGSEGDEKGRTHAMVRWRRTWRVADCG